MRKSEIYHSYKGEVGRVADNHLKREFYADKPFKKLTADATQFNVRGEKVSLSTVMNLYNREILSYSISLNPNLDQILEMLTGLFAKLPSDARPLFQSDRVRLVGEEDGVVGTAVPEFLPIKLNKQSISAFPKSTLTPSFSWFLPKLSATTLKLGRPLSAFVQAVRDVAAYYSFPVLDLWAVSGIQPNIPIIKEKFMPDGLHPNDAGHRLIAECLANFINAL